MANSIANHFSITGITELTATKFNVSRAVDTSLAIVRRLGADWATDEQIARAATRTRAERRAVISGLRKARRR